MTITTAPAATTTSSGNLDSTIPWTEATAAASGADQWTKLGAKPKVLVSSTPCQSEPWFVANGKPGRTLPLHSQSSQALHLSNKFSILDERDFPPLAGSLIAPPSSPVRGGIVPLPSLPKALTKPLASPVILSLIHI